MSLRNLTVRARNLIGFGLLGLILLVVGLTALKQINSLREQALEIRDVWMQGLDWMGQIKADRLNIRLQESLAMTMPDQIDEEVKEFEQAYKKYDHKEMLDALIDIIVVTTGAIHSMGADAEGAWKEVMSTNFAKIDKETGKVRKREDGKVLKPIGWKAPELAKFLKKGD